MQINDFIEEICLVGGLRLRQKRVSNSLFCKAFSIKRRYFVNDIDCGTITNPFALIRHSSPPTPASGWGQKWGQTGPDPLGVNVMTSQKSNENGPVCTASAVNGTGKFGSICAETDPAARRGLPALD